jgi:hypothetical protein
LLERIGDEASPLRSDCRFRRSDLRHQMLIVS